MLPSPLVSYQSVCQLKHVVSQGNDDKLCPLGFLHNVVCHNGHVFEICGGGDDGGGDDDDADDV